MNEGRRIFLIAEGGVNHNGILETAMKMVDAASDAGADAVKFQTFRADQLSTSTAPKAGYQTTRRGGSESQREMLLRLELSKEDHAALWEHCHTRGIEFLSTPFDRESLEFLSKTLGLTRIKISSGDLTNGPLLLSAARMGARLILSTGMSTIGEIGNALEVLAYGYLGRSEPPCSRGFREAFCSEQGQRILREKVILLHCTTEYPAPPEETNLLAMDTMRTAFGLPVGLSDHTMGIAIPVAAAALGAAVIEKHFTLDREMPGPDHRSSLEPLELTDMVRMVRSVESSLGTGTKIPMPSESKNLHAVRKSLVAARPIRKGEVFSPENIAVKRPSGGVSPMLYWNLLGRKAVKDFETDEFIVS